MQSIDYFNIGIILQFPSLIHDLAEKHNQILNELDAGITGAIIDNCQTGQFSLNNHIYYRIYLSARSDSELSFSNYLSCLDNLLLKSTESDYYEQFKKEILAFHDSHTPVLQSFQSNNEDSHVVRVIILDDILEEYHSLIFLE